MTIAFFSNVLNSHQIALADAIYELNGGDFHFIQTRELSAARRAMGFNQYDRQYLIKVGAAGEHREEALKIAADADVAIMGAESFEFLQHRIANSRGVTFSYSERWLKQGWRNILSPNLLKIIRLYATRGHRRKWYMLAASGYLANDLRRIGIFKNRVYKWGYFPKYHQSDEQKRVGGEPVKILWVARFIDWKRPDIMIQLAEMLEAAGYDFEITMTGDGEMSNVIKSMLDTKSGIASRVRLTGNRPNEDVLTEMAASDIYCFTSTRREGWGAVLGEAMAMGCCPVASSQAGATPFLINDGKNGFIFRTDDVTDLYQKVAYLIDNPDKRIEMGMAARRTMLNEWNAETAARQLIALARKKLADGNSNNEPSSMPASPALPVKIG